VYCAGDAGNPTIPGSSVPSVQCLALIAVISITGRAFSARRDG